MERKENILAEIKSVAPALADVGNNMPFKVPEAYFELFPLQMLAKVGAAFQQPSVPAGYFESMPAMMLAKVKALENANELEAVAPALIGISKQMPYSIPVGYFENLQTNHQQNAPVTASGSDELAAVAPTLIGIGKEMPYSIPPGYFENLLSNLQKPAVISTHSDELSDVAPALMGISRQMPYSVPAGYFENLQANHQQTAPVTAIGSGELADIAPALIGISRQMPYSLPAGYFENLQAAPVQTPAPVVPIRPKFSMLKWAVAASVVALAGLFAWQYFGDAPANTNNPVLASTTTVTDSTANVELAAALANLEDTSLDTELDDAGLPADTRSALYYLDTENFETALHDFSDEEIKTQLADQATIKNKT